jgi:hypothetical protein
MSPDKIKPMYQAAKMESEIFWHLLFTITEKLMD